MRRIRRGGAYFRIADPTWADPLDAAYSVARGGRWNPPGSFPVLYLNRDLHTSRANLERRFAGRPYGPEMLDPARAPLLIQTTVDDGDFVDAVTDEGCLDRGLPATYPLELRRPDARVDLRRVDARVAEQGSHLLAVVVLLEDLHGDAVPQVVRL